MLCFQKEIRQYSYTYRTCHRQLPSDAWQQKREYRHNYAVYSLYIWFSAAFLHPAESLSLCQVLSLITRLTGKTLLAGTISPAAERTTAETAASAISFTGCLTVVIAG